MIILYFVICMLVQVVYSEIEPRILNGAYAAITEFPFFVELGHCGAAILSERWLVTAAHCVDDPLTVIRSRRVVYAGGNRRDNSKVYRYDELIIHPKYTSEKQGFITNDIALLRMQNPLNYSDTIRPVKLPAPGVVPRNPAHVFVGRGLDETGRPSKSLMKINVHKLSQTECSQVYGFQTIIKPFITENTLICVRRVEKTPGVCMGDSGSPLVQNDVIVGIASFLPISKRDCTLTNVAFFTHVAPFVPWIKSITGLQ